MHRWRPWIYFCSHFEGNAKAKEFARRLVSGVVSQRLRSTGASTNARKIGSSTRLAKVDLVILAHGDLRIGFLPRHSVTVSLDEAIEIAKRFGSEDSATFINGVLDQIAQSQRVSKRE